MPEINVEVPININPYVKAINSILSERMNKHYTPWGSGIWEFDTGTVMLYESDVLHISDSKSYLSWRIQIEVGIENKDSIPLELVKVLSTLEYDVIKDLKLENSPDGIISYKSNSHHCIGYSWIIPGFKTGIKGSNILPVNLE